MIGLTLQEAQMALSTNQRTALWAVALFGLLGPNGVFLYYALFRWNDLLAALQNPVTLAFVIEAFLVMGLLAVYFAWKPMGRWGWKTFIVLSLIGGLGFAIPAFVAINSPSKSA